MTKIALIKDGSLEVLVCNGRRIAYNGRINKISNASPGRWEGEAGGELFEIIGGTASGGAANEWFVKWSPGYGDKYIPFNSAKRCLLAIENC